MEERTFIARPFALVTGASTGIGYELAGHCAEHGFDLLIAGDEPSIEDAARTLRARGIDVEAVEADLSTEEGVEQLYRATRGRRINALLANAGRGLGRAFLDQDFVDVRRVIDTNITGTVALIKKVGRDMREHGQGRILLAGSIAGVIPGTSTAVYNGTRAFIDSFALALRAELEGSGVTVTCLTPGPTETVDTKVAPPAKDDPRDVARAGFEAMMRGEADVVSGSRRKGGSMNAVLFLKQEHEKAKAEFEKVLKASPTTRGGLWEHLVPELQIHEEIEDVCLYEPISRNATNRDSLIAAWRDEHQAEVEKVEDLMEEIEDLEPESPEWLEKVTEVHTSLRAHIQEEEGTIFPRLPGVWDAARLERAGRELEEMKASKVSARR
jgi:uncharacterized protein